MKHHGRVVRERYPGWEVREFEEQGGCSLTFLVRPREEVCSSADCRTAFIVQIRPEQYSLNLGIARAVKRLYPTLAPSIRCLDFDPTQQICGYEMDLLPGIPVSRIMHYGRKGEPSLVNKRERLIESFAAFIARAWHFSGSPRSTDRLKRADSPMEDTSDMLSQCTGKVGSSIIYRLEKLAAELPEQWLREKAKLTLCRIRALNDWPVVLNHGDLIPSNILVDQDTWDITGVVDWIEAEHLPFATCLYGLEHLLGHLTTIPKSYQNTSSLSGLTVWIYYDKAPQLRRLFWDCMWRQIPEIKSRMEDIITIRDLGVLLWHGIAWDDGAIDRVVNEKDDAEELAKLRAFLSITDEWPRGR